MVQQVLATSPRLGGGFAVDFSPTADAMLFAAINNDPFGDPFSDDTDVAALATGTLRIAREADFYLVVDWQDVTVCAGTPEQFQELRKRYDSDDDLARISPLGPCPLPAVLASDALAVYAARSTFPGRSASTDVERTVARPIEAWFEEICARTPTDDELRLFCALGHQQPTFDTDTIWNLVGALTPASRH